MLVARNYLRVRGEYGKWSGDKTEITELPPRARRILTTVTRSVWPMGTTSACAENTSWPFTSQDKLRNYLRVRGEYPTMKQNPTCVPELPPRARRIHRVVVLHGDFYVNYLRVRGEYTGSLCFTEIFM